MKIKRCQITGCILGLFLAAGCAQVPNQRGSWTGIAVPLTLNHIDGIAHEAVGFQIEGGTKIGDGNLKGWYGPPLTAKQKNEFLCRSPVLADTERYLLPLGDYLHHRLQIQGKITGRGALDRLDNRIVEWFQAPSNRLSGSHLPRANTLATKMSNIKDLGLAQ